MAGRGIHFALTSLEFANILKASSDAELMAIIAVMEATWDTENLAESDKAWDAIHRCLTDGSLLYDSGTYPLNHVICGGRALHKGDDYTVMLVTPAQVADVAAALAPANQVWLRERYFSLINPNDYEFEHGDEDFAYTWEWFQGVRALYEKAAGAGRAVIFTVDA